MTLAGLIFATLFTSRPAFFVFVAIAIAVAQTELYRALEQRGHRPALPLGVAAGAFLMVAAYQRGTAGVALALTVAFLGAILWFVVEQDREAGSDRVASTMFGVLYIPLLGAHVTMMSLLEHGPAITVCYFGLVAFHDIGAYAFGSLFGKRPFAPSISPRKTWEGIFGATLFIFVLALLVGPMIDPFDAGSSAVLAAIVAIVAPLGDLAESMIKRDLDIKDMGSILPGHGGLLDRIDALLLVAPAFYWFVREGVL